MAEMRLTKLARMSGVWTRRSLMILLVCAPVSVLAQNAGAAKGEPVMQHAHGTFEVKMAPLGAQGIEGVSGFSIDKTIHGDLEATTKGEMYSAGDFKSGAAGYVAIEAVTGTLGGRKGSFVLQHFATMDASGPSMMVKVAPGSGTGELKGLAGTFVIHIADGKHSYDLDYTLPAT